MRLPTGARSAWILAGLAAAVGLYVALQPPAWQVSHVLPDDAYYYLQIARNVAAGQGSTLDGINLTNGYHPLWMAALVALYRALPEPAVVPAALIIGALLGGLTLLLLQRLLVRLRVSASWQLVGLGLVGLNPWLLLQWVNGLETAAASATLVGCWLVCLAWIQSPNWSSWRWAAGAAALGGLATLGRTDHLILVIPPLLYAWWVAGRDWRRLLAMAGAGLAVLAPWLAWNLATFGSIEQSSGAAFSYTQHQLLLTEQGTGAVVYIKGAILGSIQVLRWLWYAAAAPGLWIGLAALVAAAAWRTRATRAADAAQRLLWALALGVALLLAAHGAIRWSFRTWYAVPTLLASATLLAAWGTWSSLALRRSIALGAAALGVAAYALAAPLYPAEHAGQALHYAAAQWIAQNVPADARVGAFNSGIQAYFSGRTVVNLDGLVSNAAAAALREGQLWAYVRSQQLGYLVDYDVNFTYRQAWAWGGDWMSQVEQVAEIQAGSGRGPIRAYRVLPAS